MKFLRAALWAWAVLSPLGARASSAPGLDDYFLQAYVGEKKTSNYSGPLDPRSVYSAAEGKLLLLDDIFKERYLNSQLAPEIFELYHYWFGEAVEKSACPNVILNENMDYIRYLYRLVAISYLFEMQKLTSKLSSALGAEKNVCSLTYKNIFSRCAPGSSDMKKFHERLAGKFANELDRITYPRFSKKEREQWLESFHKDHGRKSDPVAARLNQWCGGKPENCATLSVEAIKKKLGDFCREDAANIQLLCSEKDSYYGMSGISTPTDLIRSSNAFNLINQSGAGEECLRRYGKLFREREVPYENLNNQFPLIFSYLLKNNIRYLQGELFLPGALKEFDLKGLSDFLTALKPPKPPVELVKPKPRPLPPPPAPPKEVKIEKLPEPVVETPVEVEIAKPYVSEFERKVIERREKDFTELAIDMAVFREDFEFTSAMVAELAGPIHKFQMRSTISDMKTFDYFGLPEAPVGLAFLKFLIDTENHQGLYNIVTVVGEKFYVKNDLEKKTEPHYIQFKNDTSTGNKWQIILLKPPSKKEGPGS